MPYSRIRREFVKAEMPICRRAPGFTLVEVMVALAVVALSVPALLFALDQQIDGSAHLRDRGLAQVVAANRMSEIRLGLRAGRPLPSGTTAGEEEMAGRRWYWYASSTATGVPNFIRMEVRVSDRAAEQAPALYTLVGFIAGDAGPVPGS